MIVLLVSLLILLTLTDSVWTIEKVHKYGLMVELNPVIQKLVRKFGVEWGVSLGILLPTFVIIGIGWHCHSFLIFILGMRTTLLLFQLKGRQLERARQSNTA